MPRYSYSPRSARVGSGFRFGSLRPSRIPAPSVVVPSVVVPAVPRYFFLFPVRLIRFPADVFYFDARKPFCFIK